MLPETDTRSKAQLLAENQKLAARIEALEQTAARQQQAEDLLRSTERQSRAWLEYSPVCTKIVDLDFNLQYMSTAGVKGLQIDDITTFYGKPYPFDFYPQSFRDAMTGRLQTSKDTGEITTLEASVVDINDNELWFHSTLVPVHDDDGQVDYIIVVSIDITERKQAEEERMLMERQVQHAQKLESLGVLSGGIAHDFNNILMSILGNADLALHALPADSPARVNIKEVENASRRAADLAQQMLAYSGQGRFVTESIDLAQFVEEMIHLLKVSISRQVELQYEFSDNLPAFEGDATQIRQVIMNLITNASDAIGDDRGTVRVSTGTTQYDSAALNRFNESVFTRHQQTASPGLFTWLEVTDTGCGMDEATIARIFDPFFTTKVSGRGLGMSAVQGIIRGHGGAISVRSEPGQGTTFRVMFPASRAADDVGLDADQQTADSESWRGEGTILIVDDEEQVCAVGRMMLERLGFEVITATDGQQALDIFASRTDEIVCVLLDLTMPQFSGEQVLDQLHQIRPETPVILCSGYSILDSSTSTDGRSPANFIQKPYSLATLQDALKQVLDPADPQPQCLDEATLNRQAAQG